MGLQTFREIGLKEVLAYDVLPSPASMFENVELRVTIIKSVLKRKLQVEHTARRDALPQAVLYCILL